MADRELIGNCLYGGLLSGSVLVWCAICGVWKARGTAPLTPAEPHPVSWRAAPVCATFLVAYLLPTFLMTWIASRFGPLDRLSLANVQWQCLCVVVQIVTVVGLLALAGPLRKLDFGLTLVHWRSDLVAGAAGCLASFLPIHLATSWQQVLQWRGPDDKHVLFRVLTSSSEPHVLIWIVVSAVVVAPLAEELLYRVLLQGWAQSRVAAWQAIGFSSFVFVVQHEPFDWLPLIPLALILGYVYNRRRSFLAVFVLHALFNGVMLVLAILTRK